MFVLAGIIGASEKWAEFSDEWRSVLDLSPRLEYFKMSEAANLREQFSGWTEGARDKRLLLLVRTINRYRFRVIHAAIDLSGHAATIGAEGIRPWRDPYFLPFQAMVIAVCEDLLGQGHDERFEIIFDEQAIFGPRAKAWYPVFKDYMEPEAQAIMPIEPMFRSDKEFLPIQAADLFAWFFRRAYSDMPTDSFAWIFEKELGNTETSADSQIFTRERMAKIIVESFRVAMPPDEARHFLSRFGLRSGRDLRRRDS